VIAVCLGVIDKTAGLHGLRAISLLEVNVLDVVARGLLGDDQLPRDVAARGTAGHEQQDLELACGEPAGTRALPRAGAGVAGGGQDVLRRVGVEPPRPHVPAQLGGRLLGPQCRAVRSRLGHRVVRVRRRQDPCGGRQDGPRQRAVIARAVQALVVAGRDGPRPASASGRASMRSV
jgi:hypothetical protein